tara:strand:- start:1517 stop:1915 length:399 start_codon:yes stop_codon:yes gene_type:complete
MSEPNAKKRMREFEDNTVYKVGHYITKDNIDENLKCAQYLKLKEELEEKEGWFKCLEGKDKCNYHRNIYHNDEYVKTEAKTKSQMIKLKKHWTFVKKMPNGKTKRMSFIHLWMTDPFIKLYWTNPYMTNYDI